MGKKRNAMDRRSMLLAAVAVSLLPVSSCTCHQETPEPPPKLAARPLSFGAGVTPRQLPDQLQAQGVITPRMITPAAAPSLPPTPDQSKIPDNFPEGVPLPYGAKVMAVQNLANNAQSVVFSTDSDTPETFNLYKNTMTGSGWGNPTQEYQGKEQSFLSFKKGDTITNISVSKDPKTGKRIVAVMYYEEKPLPFPEF
jgi:hypothetical protein